MKTKKKAFYQNTRQTNEVNTHSESGSRRGEGRRPFNGEVDQRRRYRKDMRYEVSMYPKRFMPRNQISMQYSPFMSFNRPFTVHPQQFHSQQFHPGLYSLYQPFSFPKGNERQIKKKKISKSRSSSRSSSPLIGSEEYTLRKVQQTSELIMKQLLNPQENAIDQQVQDTSSTHPSPDISTQTDKNEEAHQKEASCSTLKNKVKKLTKHNIEEIQNKIMSHLINLNDGRRKNLINSQTSGLDSAISHIQKQARLESSRANRNVTQLSSQNEEYDQFINSIIPDMGIKIEDLPAEFINQLKSSFEIDMDFLAMDNYANFEEGNMESEISSDATFEIPHPMIVKSETPSDTSNNFIELDSIAQDETRGIIQNFVPIKTEIEESHNASVPNQDNCSDIHPQFSEIIADGSINVPNIKTEPEDVFENPEHNPADLVDDSSTILENENIDNETKSFIEIEENVLDFENLENKPLEKTMLEEIPQPSEEALIKSIKVEKDAEVAIQQEINENDTSQLLINDIEYHFTNDNFIEENLNSGLNKEKTIETSIDVLKSVYDDKLFCYHEDSTNKAIKIEVETQTELFSENNSKSKELVKKIDKEVQINLECPNCSLRHTSQAKVSRSNSNSKTNSLTKSVCSEVGNSHYPESFEDLTKKLLEYCHNNTPDSLQGAVKLMMNVDDAVLQLTKFRQNLFCKLADEENLPRQQSEDKRVVKKRKSPRFKPDTSNRKKQAKAIHDITTPKGKKYGSEDSDKEVKTFKKRKTSVVENKKLSPTGKDMDEILKTSENGTEKLKDNMVIDASTLSTVTTENDANSGEMTQSDKISLIDLFPVHSILDFKDNGEKVLVIKIFQNTLVTAAESGKIFYHSLEDGSVISSLQVTNVPITCLSFLKEAVDSKMFVGSFDTKISVYGFGSRKLLTSESIDDSAQCMEMKWDYIFVGCMRGRLIRYSLKKEKVEFSEHMSDNTILVLKATLEGARRVLLVGARNTQVCIRDAFSGLRMRNLEELILPTVYSLVLEKSMVFCGTTKHNILVFSFHEGRLLKEYKATNSKGIGCVKIVGNLLFASCHNGLIYVYNLKTNKFIDSVKGPGGVILSMEIVFNQIIVSTMSFQFKAIEIPYIILRHSSTY